MKQSWTDQRGLGNPATRGCLCVLLLAGCIPVPREQAPALPPAPPPPSLNELYGRFHIMLDPLWAGLREGTSPSADDIHAAVSNFDAMLMLDENHPRLHAAYAMLWNDLENAEWSLKRAERTDLRGMIFTAKEILKRYYVRPTPGNWRQLLSERPEVACLGQTDDDAVLLEVVSDPEGRRGRERAIVVLGEVFADVLRLVDITGGKIVVEYLPLMQEFEIPKPSA